MYECITYSFFLKVLNLHDQTFRNMNRYLTVIQIDACSNSPYGKGMIQHVPYQFIPLISSCVMVRKSVNVYSNQLSCPIATQNICSVILALDL